MPRVNTLISYNIKTIYPYPFKQLDLGQKVVFADGQQNA